MVNLNMGAVLRIGQVPVRDAALFFRQLAVMLAAGISLVVALESLQQKGSRTGRALPGIIAGLKQGKSLATSLAASGLFSETAVTMVQAGELGGRLDVVLGHLADYLEREHAAREKLKSALMYPCVVVLIAVFSLTILVIYVLPLLGSALQQLGGTIPYTTAVFLAIGRFIQDHALVVVIGTACMVVAVGWAVRDPRARQLLDPLTARMPVLGSVVRRAALARFCRTLSTLVETGVPILSGLEMAGRCSGNRLLVVEVRLALRRVHAGSPLAESLAGGVMFPPPVVQIIDVGEKSGALSYCLDKAANLYDHDTQYAVERLTRLIEPALIVTLGSLIGFIILSVLMPMFAMLDAIR